jgi:hypothetical protein
MTCLHIGRARWKEALVHCSSSSVDEYCTQSPREYYSEPNLSAESVGMGMKNGHYLCEKEGVKEEGINRLSAGIQRCGALQLPAQPSWG